MIKNPTLSKLLLTLQKQGIVFCLSCISLFTATNLKAQLLINPATDGGFENGTTLLANGWTTVIVNANNQWFVGTVATGFTGLRGAYVTSNGGTNNQYQPGNVRTMHFYKDVAVPAGAGLMNISFSLKGNGEVGLDRLLVYIAPTSVTPVANVPVSPATVITGTETLIYTQVTSFASYTTQTIPTFTVAPSTTMRIIFTWQNDGGGSGTQPPAAIDNISVSVSPPPSCPAAISSVATGVGSTSATANWTCGGCTGTYIIEYGLAGFTPGNAGTAGSGSSTVVTSGTGTVSKVLTGLLSSSTYQYYVRQVCSGPAYSANSAVQSFSTLLANDNCSGAVTLTVNSGTNCTFTTPGNSIGATQSQPACTGTGSDDDVWFKFVATSAVHIVTVSQSTTVSPPMGNIVLEVYSGSCASLSLIACVNNTTGGADETISLTGLIPSNTYFVIIHSFNANVGTQGTFDVCVITPPNPCTSISTITCGTTNTSSLVTAGAFTLTSCDGLDATPGQELIYSYTPSITGNHTLTITATSGTSDYVDFFWKPASGGCNASGWSCFGSVSTNGTGSLGTVSLTGGVQYYIMADRENISSTGTATKSWNISCPVPALANDNCSGATPVTCGGSVSGNTTTATDELAGVPTNCGSVLKGVWHTITPPSNSVVTLATCGSSFDTWISVFTGACASLTCLTDNDDFCGLQSTVIFNGTAGVTYRILVAGFGGASGAYTLTANCAVPPVNDICTGAIPITCGSSVSGNTSAATDDTGFPSCPGTGNNNTGVWHTIVPGNGLITLSTCTGTAWNTFIRVFSGTCGSLTCVANNNNTAGCGNGTQSEVTFTSSSGTTYYILISGTDATENGPYTLTASCIICTTPPVGGTASGPSSRCTGSPMTFNVTGGSGTYQWQYSAISSGGPYTDISSGPFTAISGETSASATFSATTAGTYYIVCTRGSSGCADEFSTVVTTTVVSAGAVLTAATSPSIPLCPGNMINLLGNYSTGVGSLTITVSGTGFLDETSWQLRNSLNVVIFSGGPYGFGSTNTVVVSPAASDYPVTFRIETNGTFDDNVADYSVVCNTNSITLVSGTLSGGSLFTSGPLSCAGAPGGVLSSPLWTGPNGFTSSVQNPPAFAVTANSGGVYTISGFTANGCAVSSSVNVSVNPSPVPVAGNQGPYCDGQQVFLNSTPHSTYNWSGPNGFSSTGIQNPSVPPLQTPTVGTHTYTLTVTNIFGCSATTTTDVVINALPVLSTVAINLITCTGANDGSIELSSTGSGDWLFTDGSSFQVTDVGNSINTVTFGPLSPGTNSYHVTDANGCENAPPDLDVFMFEYDPILPTISCPANINTVATSASGTIVNYTAPVGTDNCAGATTVMIAGFTSGSTFPIGTTTVTYEVTDALAGLTAQCSFTVTVVGAAPVIVCPANITVNNTPGLCGANVSYAATETTGIPASVITYSIAPGSFFNVGTVTVTATATNPVGTSTCSFTVTVTDNQPPTATCQNITVNLSAGGTASITASQVNNGSTDNCGAITLSASPTTFNCSNTAICPADLFISEYIEGSGNNKAIEIYNGTGAAVNLAAGGYSLKMYFNGSTTVGLTIPLTGSIANGDVYVVAATTSNAGILAQADLTSAAGFFNGDDAVVLEKSGGILLDIIGQIGCDPGTQWSLGGNSTLDRTLFRNGPVASGVTVNPTGACSITSFPTLSTQWTGFATDNIANLGSHSFSGCIPTPVVLTVTDASGNTATCTAQVTVRDITTPSISCPGNVTIQCNTSQAPSATGTATATDACGSPIITFSDVNSLGGCNGTGTITRTWRATDASGNFSTCVQVITVIDNAAPQIVTPAANQTVQCDGAGNIAAVAAFLAANGGAVATDNCGAVTWTYSFGGLSDGCGATGTGTAIFYVTDVCGNVNSTSATFTIVDNIAPALTLPTNITIQCNTSQLPVATGTATATDACSGTPPSIWINEFHYDNAGADVNEFIEIAGTAGINLSGNSLLLYNGAGGAVYATIPLSGVLPNLGNGYGALSFAAVGLQNGNPDGIALVNTSSLTVIEFISYGGTMTGIGGIANGITSTDVGVTESGTATGTSISRIGSGSSRGQFTWALTTTQTQNAANIGQTFVAAGSGITITFTDVNSLGGCNNTGTIARTWTATDVCGNASSGTQTIMVIDNTAPVITTAASNSTVQCNGTGNAAQLNAWLASNGGTGAATDNCGAVTWTHNFIALSDLCGATGSATVTFTATDACNNSSTTMAAFTIMDNVPPNAVCQDITIYLDNSGTAFITAAMIDNGSDDNCSGVSLSASQTTFDCSDTGPNNVTLAVTDDCGNSSNCTAIVTVVDDIDPEINCALAPFVFLTTDPGVCGASYTYTAPVGTDNCSSTTVQTAGLPSGSVFPVGQTTNTFVVTDASLNTATCSFDVIVIDNENPTITCPANITVNNSSGLCGANITYTVTFNDNCLPGTVLMQLSGLPSGSFFPVGTTANSYRVTDASGNTATCSFLVTVVDNENPVFTAPCPASFSSCNPVMWTPPVATDNCSVTLTSNYPPGATLPSGTTTVIYTATDPAGHSVNCSFNVTVLEPSVAATGITSNRDFNNICLGENATLTLNGGTLGDGAMWKWYSGSCGGTLIATGVTSVTVTPATTTTYFARAEGICNTTACVSITVVVSTGPPPNTVTIQYAPAVGYVGLTDVIIVNPVAGATFYLWTKNQPNNPSLLLDGQPLPYQSASNTVTATFTATQQNYNIKVLAGNACGRSNNANIRIRGTVSAPASINGSNVACAGSSGSYTSAPIANTTGYFWSLIPASAGTIVGNGSQTVTVSFAAGFTTAQLCCHGQTTFNLNGPDLCITISNTTAAPGPVSGNANPCQGATVTYSIASVAGASSYIWTAPSGSTIVNNGISANITFPNTSFIGQVCVNAVSICGPSSSPSCFGVTSGIVPPIGSVTGPLVGICGATNVNYQLGTSGALSYTWSAPGATIMSGQGSNSINVDFPGNYAASTISVIAAFPCGNVNTSLGVTGAPSTPTVTPATLCANGADLYTASSTGGDTYSWVLTGGTSFFNNPPVNNENGIQWGPSGNSFSVTANNGCGSSAAYSLSQNCRIKGNQAMIEKLYAEIYPNPTHGSLTVEFNSPANEKYVLKVSDFTGRLITTEQINATEGLNQLKMDMSSVAKGIYFFNLMNEVGQSIVIRVAIQ